MNEIEVTSSSTGETVLRWNGRHLCSRQNPAEEARQWVESRSHLIRGAKSLILIGLGAGFHVRELLQRYPLCELIVIEFSQAIVEQHQRLSPSWITRTTVVVVTDLDQVMASGHVRSAISRRYAVLTHPSGHIVNPELARETRDLLLGRSTRGLRFLLDHRSEDKGMFNREGFLGLQLPPGQGLSIKDLSQHLNDQGLSSRVGTKIAMLMELIK